MKDGNWRNGKEYKQWLEKEIMGQMLYFWKGAREVS